MKKLLLILLLAATPAQAYDRRVRVVNHTGSSITGLYASNVGENNWTYNMLSGNGSIDPGESRIANTDDGSGYCKMDLLAVFANGDRVSHYAANVCTVTTWTINEGD
jgi:hypothetical protein